MYEINGRLITLWKNAFIFSRVKAYFSRKKEGGRERKKCRNEEKIVLIAPDLLKTEISHIPIFTSFISLSFTLSVSLSTTEAAAAAGKGRERHIFWYHLFFPLPPIFPSFVSAGERDQIGETDKKGRNGPQPTSTNVRGSVDNQPACQLVKAIAIILQLPDRITTIYSYGAVAVLYTQSGQHTHILLLLYIRS